ncbi:MAG TPA: protein kinase, partial [Planctomycetota bacterium]|nr:protein kinase [Planctomycetota bacterium]
ESGTLEPKIVDLGIVKSLNSAQLTMMNQVKGTFFYLAPELIYQDADYSIQSDMYGLGLTLFYLLQRTDLFEEPEHVLHFVQTGNVPDKFKQIQNRNLAKVLFKMIDRDPKKRFQSYPELLQALTALEASIRSTSPAVAPQQAQQQQAQAQQAQARLQQARQQQTGFPRDQEFLQKNQQEVGKLKNTLQELIQYIKVLKDATLEFEGNNRNPQGLSPQSINILKHNLQQMNNFKQDINSFIQCIRNIKDRITALEQINGAIQ